MRTLSELVGELTRLDGKPYGAYRDVVGTKYALADGVEFVLDRAQTDPYAPPSLAHLVIGHGASGIQQPADRAGLLGAEDFLTRKLAEAAARHRDISFGRPGQEILERTSVRIDSDATIVRCTIQLPARGRRILGRAAAATVEKALGPIVASVFDPVDMTGFDAAVEYMRDVESLREWLVQEDLVAFVGNGANLARRAGNSDEPKQGAVEFRSPKNLERSVTLASGLEVTGMAIPRGVTVIVGGGYHGKSTLLRALQLGVYPHIPGDGREWVITRPDAVAIRAEDGRAATNLNISPFISGLPSGEDTRAFSTENASGSTSQAANLVEALEAGTTTLLIDEDTSATNFMLRDARMRALIAADKEPITPFVERVRELYEELGVSTVLVAGGSGAFFDVADHVIALDSYRVFDVTDKALALAHRDDVDPTEHQVEFSLSGRTPVLKVSTKAGRGRPGGKRGAQGRGGQGRKPAGAKGRTTIKLGRDTLDLGPAEQLADPAQTTGIAHGLDRLVGLLDGTRTLPEAVDDLERTIDTDGLDAIAPYRGNPGIFARPRRHELMAAVNRFRGLR